MTRELSLQELRGLGFEWPKHALIEEHCVVEDGRIDLDRTLGSMQSSRSFYRGQINQAFNFKQQTGADYSDFTDRFDEYARRKRELDVAIAYLEEIIEATKDLGATDR
jgi:hypothetical protein